MKVAEITLWMFGGVAKLEGDADDAGAEFRIAAAGPMMSLVTAVVFGVSRDSIKSHASFRSKYELTIPLISDPDRKLHEGFGAWGEKLMYGKKVLGTIRSTFLVKDGKVVRAWPSVKVDGHVDAVIEALKA